MDGQPELGVGVYGFILRSDKTFLLVQRSPDDPPIDLWEFPGGAMEANEEVVAGVLREVNEETGLDVEVVKLVAATNFRYKSDRLNKMRNIVAILYLCRMVDETQQVTLSDEHQSFAWVTADSLPKGTHAKLLHPAIEQLKKEGLL